MLNTAFNMEQDFGYIKGDGGTVYLEGWGGLK
jgi:hypothetical protein